MTVWRPEGFSPVPGIGTDGGIIDSRSECPVLRLDRTGKRGPSFSSTTSPAWRGFKTHARSDENICVHRHGPAWSRRWVRA